MSEQNTEYNFNEVNGMLDISENRVFDLFASYKKFSNDYQEFLKEYNLKTDTSFNIFSSINKKYKLELYHSDIIKSILDPSTKDIGNPRIIRSFIKDFLNNISNKIKLELELNQLEFSDKIKVEREKMNIDILITDEKKEWAIIIENKINGAGYQKDQLGRYYREVKDNMRLKLKAIVCLTLTSGKEIGGEEPITETNPEKRKEIERLIIPVSAIGKENSFTDFIEECIPNGNNKFDELTRVYYTQYIKLLKSIGENSMCVELMKDPIEKIYSDKEKLADFKAFGKLWEKKQEVILEIIWSILKKNNFKEYHNEDQLYQEIDDTVSLGFDKTLSLGFVNAPDSGKLGKELQDQLESIWNNSNLKDIFLSSQTSPQKDDYWVYKTIDIDKFGNFDNFFGDIILSNISILKENRNLNK